MKVRRNYLPDIKKYEDLMNELLQYKEECEGKIKVLSSEALHTRKKFHEMETIIGKLEREKLIEYSQIKQPSLKQLRRSKSKIIDAVHRVQNQINDQLEPSKVKFKPSTLKKVILESF